MESAEKIVAKEQVENAIEKGKFLVEICMKLEEDMSIHRKLLAEAEAEDNTFQTIHQLCYLEGMSKAAVIISESMGDELLEAKKLAEEYDF